MKMSENLKPPFGGTPSACLPPNLRKPRLRRTEASEYLELTFGITVAPATLAKWASTGGGPRYQKNGVSPLYPVAELDLWAANRLGTLRTSTADEENA